MHKYYLNPIKLKCTQENIYSYHMNKKKFILKKKKEQSWWVNSFLMTSQVVNILEWYMNAFTALYLLIHFGADIKEKKISL